MKSLICQCCGMLFSEKLRGTNRDRSKNNDYCLNCYRLGEFTDHKMTITGMEKKLLRMARRHKNLNIEEANETIKILPDLKRWKLTHIL